MRRRPTLWIILAVLVLCGVAILWRSSKVQSPQTVQSPKSKVQSPQVVQGPKSKVQSPDQSLDLANQIPANVTQGERLMAEKAKKLPKFKNRLSNTEATVGEL